MHAISDRPPEMFLKALFLLIFYSKARFILDELTYDL